MLSRRRSSERASVALSPSPQTPAQRRLDSALRGASILFSVQAQLDPSAVLPAASTTSSVNVPRQALPRLPDLSGELASSDVTVMRRLFSRDARLRRSRAAASGDARPTHHLAVASHGKNGDVIRLHQLVDHGAGARAAVHRTWPLVDLRKIDGLGRPVKESIQFAMFFASSTRMTAWRCNTPLERATFLWALLQTCVSQLKRAPPVSNLLLLDLQTMAETPVESEKGEEDDSSSGAFQPAASRAPRMNSSLDELAAEREQQSADLMRATADPSDTSINPALSPNGSTTPSTLVANNSASGQGHSQGQVLFEEVEEDLLDSDGERVRGESPQSLIKARGRMMREMSKNQRVKRTLSEPKASKLHVDSAEDSDVGSDAIPKKADTLAPSKEAADPNLKELNIDERAFLAAAKRMGANRSFEMKRVDAVDRVSSQESDPKARLFQHRLKMGEANTAKVVAERKLQQEKKLFTLSSEEQRDLTFALDRFRTEKRDRPLYDFGAWAEARIQALEVENIADIVNVEKSAMPDWLGGCRATDSQHKPGTLEELERGKWPYDTLVDSMTFAEPWLEKCQTLLAPYAELAEDINKGVILLEVQRKNASDLNKLLTQLIELLCFEHSEQSLVDGIGTADAAFNLSEFDGEDFQNAARVIASKVSALRRLSALSEMAAVTKVQKLLSQRQREASTILVPMLKGYIDQLYVREEVHIADRCVQKIRTSRLQELFCTERAEFLTGVKSLSIFGRREFVALVEHFLSLSSTRVMDLFGSIMGEEEGLHGDIAKLVVRTEMLSECLFYACAMEGSQAFQLFARVMESPPGDEAFCLSKLLRRQINNNAIISEVITKGSSDDKALQTCLHLHAAYYLDYFSERVAGSNDQAINALIRATESQLSGSFADKILVQGGKDSSAMPLAVTASEAPVQIGTWPSSNVSVRESPRSPVSPGLDSGDHCFGDRESLTDSISNFFDVCRDMCNGCNSFAEEQVSRTIASLSTPVDIDSDSGRAEFFSFVRRAVDLCDQLTSPTFGLFEGPIAVHHMREATRSQCERLVAAVMRRTEISTHGCVEHVSDIVKLQCYGYITAKLGIHEKPDFLIPLAHLSTRVWKHVMAKWAERELFGSLFSGLELDSSKRPAEAHAKFQSAVLGLNVAQTVSQVKQGLFTALGSTANGAVMLPVCDNFIYLTKERLEDTLRLAKKQKVSSEARSRLHVFSRDLLSSLRTEVRGKQPDTLSR